MGFITTVFILSLRLLYTSLSFFITGRLKPNKLTSWDHILARMAPIAGDLTLAEAIVLCLHLNLVLVALAISRLYSFIYGREKLLWIPSDPPLVTDVHTNSATKIEEHNIPSLARLGTKMRSTERGPSKPAVQCRPTYVEEQFVHSPTEDRVCRVSEILTNITQGSEIRGRTDAVAQPGTARQPVSNPSVRPASSGHQQEKAASRIPPRTKSCVRRVHTAPYSFHYMFHTPEPRNTLLGSLKGFRLHSAAPVQNTSVHVLGVGLSWNHLEGSALPGPAHDIRWLESFFSYQKQVRFRSLQDEKASFDAIHQTIAHIYADIGPNDYLILYFTGHADDNNALELYDGGSGPLSEAVLNEWIVELRRRTTKRIPVYIVFDFCRLSPVKSNVQLDSDVDVLYSCPPGQISLDLKLSEVLPYSCLLMALLLAIHDSSECHAPSLMKSLALRLTELLNVVWGTRCHRPGPGRRKRWCRHLQSCELCRDEKHGSCDEDPWPNPQLFGMFDNMHLGGSRDFSAAARYASTRFPLPLRKAYELLENNQWFMYFNPSRISTNEGSSTPQTRKFRPCDRRSKLESATGTRGKSLPLGAVPTSPKLK